MTDFRRLTSRGRTGALALGLGLMTLSACSGGFDPDFRSGRTGLTTAGAAASVSGARPDPDARGVISYPSFDVAVARRGDTINDVAARIGADPAKLARYNGIDGQAKLRKGEVIALPGKTRAAPVAATPPAGTLPAAPEVGVTPLGAPEPVDVTSLAGAAIDRADARRTRPPFQTKPEPARASKPVAARPTPIQTGAEPIRHKVKRGETAYSIARSYNVSVRSLADWNGLGPNLNVRAGSILLVPTGGQAPERVAALEPEVETTVPGAGSPTPTPPSASKPLPEEDTGPTVAVAPPPPSPDLAKDRTPASGASKLGMPVQGKIIRGYDKGKNDGIDIAAKAGTPVRAAADGTVAAITRDTDQVPILVLRHAGNLLTIYANIADIEFEKGAKISRGQTIAKVRGSNPSFLHFEVREGFDSVDPVPYLN